MNTVFEFAKLRRIVESLNRRLGTARQTIANENFLVLTDTPANYVGSAGKFVQVNGAPDGLQFALITAEDVQAGTFPVGEYTFQAVVTGIDPTLPAHLATKEYVDLAINVQMDYFFNNTLHDIGGIYYNMLDTETGEGEATFLFENLGGGDDQPLVNFANISGAPRVQSLPPGLFSAHIHAERSAGTRSVQIYFELWKRTDPGGAEAFLVTSEISGEITNKIGINLHAAIGTDTELDPTDILVIKWFANLGSGGPTDIKLYAEGADDSHLSVPVLSSVFNAIYVRQDGTTELTGNWDAGAFDITAQSFIGANVTSGDEPGHTHSSKPSKTTAPWNKSIGAGGDYPDWATMIAAMPDFIAHEVTVTIEIGTTLTEICELKNKHGITKDGMITIQAERYYPTSGAIPTGDSATATTLRDAALAAEGFGNDYFNDCWIFIVHGTGTDNGFVKITDYVDATGDVVVAAWPGTQPDATSRYIIVGALVDAEGVRAFAFDIANNSSIVFLNGVGLQGATSRNLLMNTNFNMDIRYCGFYDSNLSSIYIIATLRGSVERCGIVNSNTNNSGGEGGVTIDGSSRIYIRYNGISDNNQRGVYVWNNSFVWSRDNFGNDNGNWGTYSALSGQVRVTGIECSGAAGNHSDVGTAGDNSADQAAAY